MLYDLITTQLRQQGAISFADFMNQALYTPNLGYYSGASSKFGVEGDFVTAPELTPLFGYALANQCQEVFVGLDDPVLFEFGAGSGRLSVDLLTRLEGLNALPRAYYILELSAYLQERQRALIASTLPHLLERVVWLSSWPTQPLTGVVIANEVLDAMPVHRFLQTPDVLLESYVTLSEQDELIEVFKPCTNERLMTHVQSVLAHGFAPYQSEVNLFLEGWMQQCGAMLAQGAFFLIDYGFPRHEYYHSERVEGTLMCHYRHHAHTNPLLHVGEQDITAHVDFTHVAETAYAAGFHVAGYTNQAAFLLANGLLSLLTSVTDERERVRAQQAVKQLVQPNEMGELFKVMALTKQWDAPLTGFQWQDKRASL